MARTTPDVQPQPVTSGADRRIDRMSSFEAPVARPGSREIARAAVQAELSLAAYELVVENITHTGTIEGLGTGASTPRLLIEDIGI